MVTDADADDVTNGVHAPAVRPIDRRETLVRFCRKESRFLLGTRLARVTLEQDFPRSLLPGKTISRIRAVCKRGNPLRITPPPPLSAAIVNSSLERLLRSERGCYRSINSRDPISASILCRIFPPPQSKVRG